MDITSPYFVVPVIVGVFLACILWATGAQPEGHHPSLERPQGTRPGT